MFIPMPGTIIVKRVKDGESKTKGGIILPETVMEKNRFAIGKVVEASEYIFVGGDQKHPLQKLPIELKKGDKIFFEPAIARDIKYKSEEYFFVNYRDVYAKVKEE
jgi:chaperonin GroES